MKGRYPLRSTLTVVFIVDGPPMLWIASIGLGTLQSHHPAVQLLLAAVAEGFAVQPVPPASSIASEVSDRVIHRGLPSLPKLEAALYRANDPRAATQAFAEILIERFARLSQKTIAEAMRHIIRDQECAGSVDSKTGSAACILVLIEEAGQKILQRASRPAVDIGKIDHLVADMLRTALGRWSRDDQFKPASIGPNRLRSDPARVESAAHAGAPCRLW